VHQGVDIFERLAVDWRAKDDALRASLKTSLGASHATYLGVWESDRLIVAAGQTAFPGLRPTPLRLQLERDRARMSFPGLFPGPGDRPVADSAPAGMKLPVDRVFVVEFVPTQAQALVRRALLGLFLSSSAAALLMSAAAVLWQLGRRTDCMRGELARREQLAQLGAMSAVLAHEIRNPLSSLKGNAQLLAENPNDGRVSARIERVVRDAVRLETLTNDLLQFAQSGAVQRSPTSPARVLEAASLTVDSTRVQILTAGAPDRWSLDAGRMEQVLVNLLDNALRVTPTNLKVVAEVARSGDELVYAVRDRGPGVPASERSRIFEPFHTTRVQGTGLGLAVARRIVGLHGGRIEVDDAPDHGAVFRVSIPAEF
jgi:two-component system sensor histidine kinase HydH